MAERTLQDVINELTDLRDINEENIDATKDTTDAIVDLNETTKGFMGTIKRWIHSDRLQAKENKNEENLRRAKDQGNENAAAAASSGGLLDIFKGTFLGSSFSRLLAPIGSALLNVKGLLVGIGKLVLKGGPIAIVLTLLYHVFKDIGENENFKNALTAISDTWNNKIIPTWNDLKENFVNFLNGEEMNLAMADIQGIWNSVTAWFSGTFSTALQNLFVTQLTGIVDLISGVLSNLNTILEGNVWKGLGGLVGTITRFITDFVDSVGKFLLESIGVDFGEHSTLRSFLIEKFTSVKDSITATFTDMADWVEEKFTGIVDKVKGVFAPVTETFDWLTTQIGDYLETVKNLFIKRIEQVNGIVNDVSTKIASSFEILKLAGSTLEEQFLTVLKDVQVGFMKAGNFLRNIPDRLMIMIGNMLDFELPKVSIPTRWGDITLLEGGKPFGDINFKNEAAARISEREKALELDITKLERGLAERLSGINNQTREMRREAEIKGLNVNVVAPTSNNSIHAPQTYINSTPSVFDLNPG